MVKNAFWFAVGGLAVALAVPLVAGCSSPGGCGTCGKSSPARTMSPPPIALSVTPAGTPTATALPSGGQKTCPVTGEELGLMGKPIAVTVKGQTVYVCCRGCAAKAQADPDKTLAAVADDRAR